MPVCQEQTNRYTKLGFPDVGFRLAFPVDETVSSFYDKLMRILAQPPYIQMD
jgi:hypothetical protein